MRESSARGRRCVRSGSLPAVLVAVLVASLVAHAQTPPGQSSNPFGLPTRQPPPPEQPPTPPASPAIARVDGRVLTQLDFDRIAQPYFASLKSQLGPGFTSDIQRLANFNVLDELVRREVLAIETRRRNIQVSQDEIDALLKQDPFFLTDGKFDPVKFNNYKTSPGSNYPQVLPQVREVAAIARLDASLRRRFTPTPGQVRAEYARRNDQVRFRMLPLLTRDMPLEAETGEAEWAEHYRAHPDQFTRRTRVRLRYARLPLPAEGDTTRAAEEATALEQARAIADSLRRGTLPDTSARLMDTGLFDVPGSSIPGIGRVAALTDTLGRIDQDSTIRIVGPYTARDAVVVGTVVERRPKHVPPMREVLGDVKRRADLEKRRITLEADRRAFYQANLDRWRGTRASVTRVLLDPATIPVKPPSRQEVERWYAEHGHTLYGLSDSSKAWIPPITDSLRAVAEARITDAQRPPRAAEAMTRIVRALRTARDARGPARANGAMAETLTFVKGSGTDSLFSAPFLDSLLASAPSTKGTLQGPRAFGRHWVVWRVDAVDTSFAPPYEAVRARSDQEFAADRRAREESEARLHFEQHRGEFLTPVKYALDYVAVPVPPADSVRIPEAELRRRYDANRGQYRQEEQLKARHILFMTRDAGPQVAREAKTRADSLLAAIRKDGGDFAGLARRFSQEPGAATSGGDLGWFGRGRMVKEFEAAAFALKPGEISPVVKTQFGYHIIRLEDRKEAGVKSFEEVRGELRLQMAQARGDSSARRSANALRRRLALGRDATGLVASHGGIVSAPPIAANEALAGVGPIQGLAQDLPTLKPGAWAPSVYRATDRYLVIRVREQIPPRPAEFDEVKPQAVEAMKNARRRAVLDGKVAAVREALAAGASLDSVAAPHGGLKDSGFLGQTTGFVPVLGSEPRVVQRAFAMKPGEVTDTLQVAAGVLWLRLEETKSGDPAAYQAASALIEGELAREKYDAWIEERKKTMRIEILRPDLKGPRSSPPRTTTMSVGG